MPGPGDCVPVCLATWRSIPRGTHELAPVPPRPLHHFPAVDCAVKLLERDYARAVIVKVCIVDNLVEDRRVDVVAAEEQTEVFCGGKSGKCGK